MSAYATHLWKELRAERRTLAILALLLPATVGLLTAFLPRHTLGDGIAVDLVVAICLVTTLTAIGADLLPRERRGTAALLARVPGALATSFLAKLSLYLGLLTVAVAYGVLIAVVCSLLRRGTMPGGLDSILAPWKLGALLVVALGAFAVSAWLPRGALVLPATGCFFALMSLPFWGWFQGHPMFHAEPVHVAIGGAAIGLGALGSAWTQFVWGGRGRGRAQSVIASVAVAALGLSPVWTWTATRFNAAFTLEPIVHDVIVGEGGRFAFVTVKRLIPWWSHHSDGSELDTYTAVLVDTQTGTWTLAGPLEASCWMGRASDQAPITSRRATRVRLVNSEVGGSLDENTTWYDGEAAVALDPRNETFPSADWNDLGLNADDLDAGRAFVVGSGTGYFVTSRDLEVQQRLGDERIFVDPASGRRRGLAELAAVFGHAARSLRVLPGRWLIHRDGVWLRLDPVTLETSPAPGLLHGDVLGPSLADGSALVVRQPRVLRYWPESGELIELDLRGFAPDDGGVRRGLHVSEGHGSGHLRSDRPSVLRLRSDYGEQLVEFAPSKNALRALLVLEPNERDGPFRQRQPRLFDGDSRRALYSHRDLKTLERYDLETREVTTLFAAAWLK